MYFASLSKHWTSNISEMNDLMIKMWHINLIDNDGIMLKNNKINSLSHVTMGRLKKPQKESQID